MDRVFDNLPLVRAHGIQWDLESDHFRRNVNIKDQPPIRHGVLSTVASLYETFRFVAAVLLKAKVILQEMFTHRTDWDNPLTDELCPEMGAVEKQSNLKI